MKELANIEVLKGFKDEIPAFNNAKQALAAMQWASTHARQVRAVWQGVIIYAFQVFQESGQAGLFDTLRNSIPTRGSNRGNIMSYVYETCGVAWDSDKNRHVKAWLKDEDGQFQLGEDGKRIQTGLDVETLYSKAWYDVKKTGNILTDEVKVIKLVTSAEKLYASLSLSNKKKMQQEFAKMLHLEAVS